MKHLDLLLVAALGYGVLVLGLVYVLGWMRRQR
jgi:hypothetical protein